MFYQGDVHCIYRNTNFFITTNVRTLIVHVPATCTVLETRVRVAVRTCEGYDGTNFEEDFTSSSREYKFLPYHTSHKHSFEGRRYSLINGTQKTIEL